jgi:hypothetical protein
MKKHLFLFTLLSLLAFTEVGWGKATVTLLVLPRPGISLSTNTLQDFGSVVIGSSSLEQQYTVSGLGVSSDIVNTPPLNFEISLTTGSGFTTSPITLTQLGGFVDATTIFVRFTPLSIGFKSNTIFVTSSGSSPQGVDVSGTGTEALPVELTSFSALLIKNKTINLTWQTAIEVNNYGFEVQRSQTPQAGQASNPKSETWEKIGFVNGHGNSNSPKKYSFIDSSPLAGKVQYRLKQIDIDGKFEYSAIVEVNVETPASFVLNQNYPNPFNPTTNISYEIPVKSNVVIKVYNVLGNEVATLLNEEKQPGNYQVKFDASKLSNGIYFYTIKTVGFTQSKKMILLK